MCVCASALARTPANFCMRTFLIKWKSIFWNLRFFECTLDRNFPLPANVMWPADRHLLLNFLGSRQTDRLTVKMSTNALNGCSAFVGVRGSMACTKHMCEWTTERAKRNSEQRRLCGYRLYSIRIMTCWAAFQSVNAWRSIRKDSSHLY